MRIDLKKTGLLVSGFLAASLTLQACSVRPASSLAPETTTPEDTETSRRFVRDVNAFFGKIGSSAQFNSCVDASSAIEVLLADQKDNPTLLGYEIEVGGNDWVFGHQVQFSKDQIREAWDLRRRGAYWGSVNPYIFNGDRPTKACG